jgi:hypothetical protein
LKKAAHSYNRLFLGGLTINGSAAYMVATKWSPENGIASQRKASLHKTASPTSQGDQSTAYKRGYNIL